MLENYLPVLIFMAIGLVVGLAMIVLGFVLSPHRPDAEKLSPYECGFEAFEDARMKFDVRYYLVAILFIIFDLEIAFLFPWAVALDKLGGVGLAAMTLFLGILVIGFIYEWKKGALEWE
ncbi:MAG TPA: NADH-quinone oxidoreductase subunit A [Chromatiales bacterium]|nr:NADH-quinone oxidoreductase subunit A [Chromatiales bacterium]